MVYVLDRLETDLLACLCASLGQQGRGVCVCHVYVGGDRPPAAHCGTSATGNGQAWISRLGSELQIDAGSVTFGGTFCGGSHEWVTNIELGIYRCVRAVPNDDGYVDESWYPVDRELIDLDEQALYQALCCPVWDEVSEWVSVSVVQVERMAPQGGCAGVVMSLTVVGDPSREWVDAVGVVRSAPAASWAG